MGWISYRSIGTLIQALLTFQTAAHQLGSSVGLLASASELCDRLYRVELIFDENAAVLFPQIKSKVVDIEPPRTKRHRPKNRGRNGLFARPVAVTVSPDPEMLPYELLGLARRFEEFLVHLEGFPELVDEALNASITDFKSDLIVSQAHQAPFLWYLRCQYRADCLEEYEEQFRWSSVQRYVHSVSTGMTEPLQMIVNALKVFVDNGIPAIRLARQNDNDNLLFLSTIAIFFGGVTATTAQYSYSSTDKTIDNVNIQAPGELPELNYYVRSSTCSSSAP